MTAPVHPQATVSEPRVSRGAVGFLVVDLACILLFVVLGAETHNVSRGAGWFFNVWWPLAVGWIVAMPITRLYGTAARWPLRLLTTVGLAVLIGGPLRYLMDRPIYSIFTVVAVGFLSLATFGWRLLLVAFHQVRAAPPG